MTTKEELCSKQSTGKYDTLHGVKDFIKGKGRHIIKG